MAGMFRGYTLREDELFTAQLEALDSIKYLDEALEAIMWALSNNPEIYPIVPGTKRLRVAKTKSYERGIVTIPPLKIWFSVETDEIVLLRSIEQVKDWDTPDNL